MCLLSVVVPLSNERNSARLLRFVERLPRFASRILPLARPDFMSSSTPAISGEPVLSETFASKLEMGLLVTSPVRKNRQFQPVIAPMNRICSRVPPSPDGPGFLRNSVVHLWKGHVLCPLIFTHLAPVEAARNSNSVAVQFPKKWTELRD